MLRIFLKFLKNRVFYVNKTRPDREKWFSDSKSPWKISPETCAHSPVTFWSKNFVGLCYFCYLKLNDVIFSPWNHDALLRICFHDGIWKWVPFSYLISFPLRIVLSPVFHSDINNIFDFYNYMVGIFW